MHWDITNLDAFYQSPLGKRAQKSIVQCFESLLQTSPDISSHSLTLGLGYVSPFLKPFSQASLSCMVLPPKQGICPRALLKSSSLSQIVAEECLLPFEDKSIDLLVVVHWLEGAQDPVSALRDAWRILKDSGEILLLVPNRRSLWASQDHTPFGRGFSFSYTQITKLLQDVFFLPTHIENVLFFPPFSSKWLVLSIPFFEGVGNHLGLSINRFWAGGWIVKATKCLYAPASQAPQKYAPSLKNFLPVPHPRTKKETLTQKKTHHARA